MDNIIGVFFRKDLFRYDGIFSSRETFEQFLNRPWFVPETIKAGKLFALMTGRKSHIHFAVDEYGGLEGLITLEDILSRIFRTAEDDPEEGEPAVEAHGENLFKVSADITLDEFCDQMDLEIEESEAVTLAGFLADQLGSIPENGDSFEFEGYEFRITSVQEDSPAEVQIRRLENRDGEGEE
jgi:CBS domain containing-hemolysin-like protein